MSICPMCNRRHPDNTPHEPTTFLVHQVEGELKKIAHASVHESPEVRARMTFNAMSIIKKYTGMMLHNAQQSLILYAGRGNLVSSIGAPRGQEGTRR